jgi:hypothetical protein
MDNMMLDDAGSEDLANLIDDAKSDSVGKRIDAILDSIEDAQEAAAEKRAAAAQDTLEGFAEIQATRTVGFALRDVAVSADEQALVIQRDVTLSAVGRNQRQSRVDAGVNADVERIMTNTIGAPLDRLMARYAPRNFIPQPSGPDANIVANIKVWFDGWTALDFAAEATDALHVGVTGGADQDRANAALRWGWRGLVARAAARPLPHQQAQAPRYARLLELMDAHLTAVTQGDLAAAVAGRVSGVRQQFAAVAQGILTMRPRWPAGDILLVGAPLLIPINPPQGLRDSMLYYQAQATA